MKARKISGWVMGMLMGLLLAMPAAASDPVVSLQPLHTGREIVTDAAFEGVWEYASVSLLLKVTRNKNFFTGKTEDFYELLLCGSNEMERLSFEMHLVRLGSTVFADIRQTTEKGLFALYPHVFAKIHVAGDELIFDFMDDDYLRMALESGRTDLKHEQLDGTLVLTATTRELQNFVESCAFDEEAFDEHVSFTRLKEQPGDSN